MARVAVRAVPTGGLYERLGGVPGGAPLNVPRYALPPEVQASAPGRLGRHGLAWCQPARAIVDSDDSLVWSDDRWAEFWLAENLGEPPP